LHLYRKILAFPSTFPDKNGHLATNPNFSQTRMTGTATLEFLGQTLHLHPLKALFWEEARTLMIADLHAGKTSHFRKHGIPVPVAAADAGTDRLISVLLDFRPERVLFLGDLFHSTYNREWITLAELILQFREVTFELIPGNHDILDLGIYADAGLKILPESVAEGPWWITHHPVNDPPSGLYNLAGHIHPGVRLSGAGKQTLRLPCFYFGQKQGILPAFGTFTGTAQIPVKKGDRIYVIAADQVIKV
jgi:uncharacterized protein